MIGRFPSRTHIGRRRLLLGATAGLVAGPALIASAAPNFTADPFQLGVASGCPRPDSVVLWTRLAPDPLNGGGVGPEPVPVDWEIAEDDGFRRIAARGQHIATAAWAHSVHVQVQGLKPARWYWYRFRAGGTLSPVGRTRTAPAANAVLDRFRFAFASCQQYELGYFTALRHMAARELDLVIHLGDYIYETSWGWHRVRHFTGAIPTTLDEFRERHAQYKTDADLRALHAAFPWLVIWDDHEVADDYANDISHRNRDPKFFLTVRRAAYQAWFEHMPVPMSAAPVNGSLRIYDHYRFGSMLDVMLLDDRQYRSRHPCVTDSRTTKRPVDCSERTRPDRSILGAAQEGWLDGSLATAKARWTVLAQQTLMAEVGRGGQGEQGFMVDRWDGYPASRQRLLDSITRHRIANPVVIGGDVHSFWVSDLKRDFATKGPVVATEFVGSSVTSNGPSQAAVDRVLAANPHLKYGRGDKRGYVAMELTPQTLTTHFEAVDDVQDPQSAVRRLRSFVVENGKTGAVPA
ncbi:alkaline phosphatase [Reyranella sp. CPCC 100927]|uniref:alkaline phosphatase D family protein n=1 Tax=Reyranella sp. CPCC 100927 TaxID=2599616 RepID=UPI0011B378FD|nr:alkaline phosphatase D family protein [Reyranella sp. CPCC 100927]TWT15277.1 alkaline phosphatase [Reyranella sp. CPCC 100927]